MAPPSICASFFFNDTATTEIYTLSLHDALPICIGLAAGGQLYGDSLTNLSLTWHWLQHGLDRESTRLNSSHLVNSNAVFCLKKKRKIAAGMTVHATLMTQYRHEAGKQMAACGTW